MTAVISSAGDEPTPEQHAVYRRGDALRLAIDASRVNLPDDKRLTAGPLVTMAKKFDEFLAGKSSADDGGGDENS